MAYNSLGLRKFAYTQGAMPAYARRIWCYVSATDTLAAIATPGYIYDPQYDLGVGDRVFVEGSDGHRELIVTSVASGNIVLGNTDDANRLDLLEAIMVEMQVAGHGGMSMDNGPEAGSDITITFQTIDQMNVIDVEERGVDLTVNTGQFSVTIGGVWDISLYVNLSHDSDNAGRTTFIRIFNVTDSEAGAEYPIGIGRLQEDTNTTVPILVNIEQADIGDTYRFEIGGGDTLATVFWNQASVDFTYQGRLGALTVPATS